MAVFLTPAEVERLTGLTKRTFQIKWLNKNGYTFELNANGDPIISVRHVEQKLMGVAGNDEPDWGQMAG